MKNPWTESEEKILKDCLKRNKTKQEAYREASTMIDRSAKAIAEHDYYFSRVHLQKKVHQKSICIEEPKKRSCLTKEQRDAIVIDFLKNHNGESYDSLAEKLNVSFGTAMCYASNVRKKYPEKRLPKKYSRKMDSKELKKIMCEEITKSPNNLREAFRRIAEKTKLSEKTIGNIWYGSRVYASPGILELRRDNMPDLFYRSGSSGTAKNEKNSNKNELRVSKGRYVFNFITSLIKGKYKVKSKDKEQ